MPGRFFLDLMGYSQTRTAAPIEPASASPIRGLSKFLGIFTSVSSEKTEAVEERASSALTNDGKAGTDLANGSPGSELDYCTAKSRFSQPSESNATPPTATQTSAYFSAKNTPSSEDNNEEDDDLVSEEGALRIIDDDDELAVHDALQAALKEAAGQVKLAEGGKALEVSEENKADDKAKESAPPADSMGATEDPVDRWAFADLLAKLPEVETLPDPDYERYPEKKKKIMPLLPITYRRLILPTESNPDKELSFHALDELYRKPRKQRKPKARKRLKKKFRLMKNRLEAGAADLSRWEVSKLNLTGGEVSSANGDVLETLFSVDDVELANLPELLGQSGVEDEAMEQGPETLDKNQRDEPYLELVRDQVQTDERAYRMNGCGDSTSDQSVGEKRQLGPMEDVSASCEDTGGCDDVDAEMREAEAWARSRKRFTVYEIVQLFKHFRRQQQ